MKPVVCGALLSVSLGCQRSVAERSEPVGAGGGAAGSSMSGPAAKTEAVAAVTPLDAEDLSRILGRPVTRSEQGVLRVTQPRDDVPFAVDGAPFSPAAGLTSWAAFQPVAEGAMVMGDTVVFQDEVDGVMDAAFAHGMEVTALHNHFFFDEPKAYFLHIGGRGKPSVLAAGVQSMWASIQSRRQQVSVPPKQFGGEAVLPGELDGKSLAEVVGAAPKVLPGVVKFSLPRRATMGGDEVGGALGLSSWVAFSGSDLNASMAGDFAMTQAEVQPVLKALRSRGVHVVALHNHMVGGDPFYYFTHFWATGPALQLALAFRVALEEQVKVVGHRAVYGVDKK